MQSIFDDICNIFGMQVMQVSHCFQEVQIEISSHTLRRDFAKFKLNTGNIPSEQVNDLSVCFSLISLNF